MIPRIGKILYATDLSENSAYAFRYAINSAEKHGAAIHILYVMALPPFPMEGYDFSKFSEQAKPALYDKIRRRVDSLIELELKGNDEIAKRITVQIVEGDPASKILDISEEMKTDILIMGTHSKGIIAHTFLGSVATRVLQRTRIPVFVIPIPKKTDISFKD